MLNTFPSNKYANVTQCHFGQNRKSFLACGTATIHIGILNQNQCEMKEKSAWCLFQVCLFGFNVAFNINCHITTVFGCDRELNAHFYSAASLWYQIPNTLPDTISSHIILTPERPVLALPRKSECQAGRATSIIVNDFGMSRPGIEPGTS